ncbi:hypothetical protein BHUM_05378c [Candidatus Burkholderia humilis]|nr:hypothetical protein BHUM_05378c [Candidatus Burkholderia humilis]
MRHQSLEHRFVRNAPRELEPGVLYISMEYATAVHSCCCGCGDRVVTPFTPTDWRMTFNGESVTLSPSVGNWNQDCRSHYVIERNRVIECGDWSDERVEAERCRDKQAKAEYYERASAAPVRPDDALPTESTDGIAQTGGLWSRLRAWLSKS